MGGIGDQDSDSISTDIYNGQDANIQNTLTKKHKCPECHAIFSRPSRLERHIRSHTGERPYICNHQGCTKSYTNSSHLKRHLQTHNTATKVYRCTKCSIAISNFNNFQRHYKKMHSKDKKMSCKECGMTFNKKYQLVKHQSEHFGTIIYKCDKCTKSFMNLNKLKQHKQMHEKGAKSYPCTISGCSEVFDKWLLLCAHRKSKHVIEYKCDNCEKVFFNKFQLKVHSKIHSENRVIIPCPYDRCHKAYFFKCNLTQHVKTKHLGQKYYCDICSVGLTAKQKLIEHIRRHHEPKKKKRLTKGQRKKRKDAGIPKKSVLTGLVGVNLPNNLEKMVMQRETAISVLEAFDKNSNDIIVDPEKCKS